MKALLVAVLSEVFIKLGQKFWAWVQKKIEEQKHKGKVKAKVKEVMKNPDAQERARQIDDMLNK